MIQELIGLAVWLFGGIWAVNERIAKSNVKVIRKVYLLVYYLYFRGYGGFVSHAAKFSGPACFPHGFHGVFISGGAQIGRNCVIFHHVTIGSNVIPFSKTTGSPTIGDNCYIGAGAVIIGAVKVGRNCRVGANCTVMSDVPDNSVVVSSVSRVIRKVAPHDNRYFRWSANGPVYFNNGEWVLEKDQAVIDDIRKAL